MGRMLTSGMLTGCVTAALLCTAPVLAQQPTSRPATWRTSWTPSGCKEYLTLSRTLTEHTWLVRCLAYAPNGLLASGGKDRLICIWSPKGKLVRRVDLRPGGG